MPHETCGILIPRSELSMQLGSELGECLRLTPHYDGRHVIKNLKGIYYLWEDDLTCGCCEPEEDQRCFTYTKISEKEALELMARRD